MSRSELAWRQVDLVGKAAMDFWRYFLDVFTMAYAAIKTPIVYERSGFRSILGVILAQVYYTGVQAMPLVSALALAVGAIVIFNASALSFLGNIGMIANLLIVVVVRELGPLIVALILIARSGTAIATEIGNMRVNKEIDALETMAINPLSFIVFPRLVGGVVSIVCLTFYFNVVSLLGGFAVTRLFHDIPFAIYTDALATAFSINDVSLFLSKNILNGITVFSISCYQGLQVKESSHEVPQAATRAVISSISAVATTTLFATMIFYLKELRGLVDL